MVLHDHILALDVASLVEALSERNGTARIGRPGIDETNDRQRRLLRTYRKRQGSRRAAEKRDEFATAAHSITSSAGRAARSADRGRAPAKGTVAPAPVTAVRHPSVCIPIGISCGPYRAGLWHWLDPSTP